MHQIGVKNGENFYFIFQIKFNAYKRKKNTKTEKLTNNLKFLKCTKVPMQNKI